MLMEIIILVIIYLIIYNKKWKENERSELILKTIMYIYVSMVLFVTILPIDWRLDPKWKYHDSIEFRYSNLKPFNDLLLGRLGSFKEVTLNIIMTIPFGLLYSILKKDITLIKVIKKTFLFSLCIEFIQLLMTIFLLNYRTFDITDLITNTIGGILGYFIYKKVKIYLFKHKE